MRRRKMGGTAESSDEPAATTLQRLRRRLAHPAWQGIAGIVALVTLGFTAVQIFSDDTGKEEGDAATGRVEADHADDVAIDADGGCAVVLSDATECVVAPPFERTDFETVSIAPSEDMEYVVPVAPEALGDPPSYTDVYGHCDDWWSWLKEESAYTARPEIFLFMATGEANQVAIQAVTLEILDRQRLDQGFSHIQCQYQAGGEYGFGIDVTTSDPNSATMTDYRTEESGTMPPAAVVLNGLDYDGGVISIDSEPGYLYEGIIRVSYLSNGEPREITYGSVDEPYRWLGGGQEMLDSIPAVDWDLDSQQWVDAEYPGQ
jgi:hypothetical protein